MNEILRKRRISNEICEIMNQLISDGKLENWQAFDSPKRFPEYGMQKGWERTGKLPVSENSFLYLADYEMDEVPFIN